MTKGVSVALVRKDTMVQFRVPGELAEEFRAWCESARRRTVSEELRGYMEWRVEEARKAVSAPVSESLAAAPARKVLNRAKDKRDPAVEAEVAKDVRKAAGGSVSREHRRRLERRARKDKD